jgi:hypothetical protein
MKKVSIVLLALLSISAYAQSFRNGKELTLQNPVVKFRNNEANIDNSYNWSKAAKKLPLKEHTLGRLEAELQVTFTYGGIVNGMTELQVGDVDFTLSNVKLSSMTDMKVIISETDEELSTLEGLSLRQFLVRVQYKDKKTKVDHAFPVTVDAEGNFRPLKLRN